MEKIQSTCNYCALACNIDFYVEDNCIQHENPTETYPVNKGFSCIKGLFLKQQQQEIKPLPSRRVKRDDHFEQVDWDDAFTETAKRLKNIADEHGSESIAGLSTGQIPFEEMGLFGHIMRNYLRGNLDGNTRLCMATSVMAYKQSFGFDAPPYTLNDVEESDTIIFIGANPVVAHPIFWGRVRQNSQPNKKVLVIDTRKSETALQSDTHYQIKAKSDLVLFYILAQVLIEKNWIDETYIEEHTEKFSEFKDFLQNYTIDRARLTGLTEEQIIELATTIHQGKRVSFWWTMGVNQGYEAVRTAQSIINLALMTGNMGKPGTGANSLTGQSNAMGSRLFSNSTGLYGGGDFNDPLRRDEVAQALNIDQKWLPEKPTLPYNTIIEKINQGEIKALWVVATNPYHSWPNNQAFDEIMSKLDLLIVQDLYADTATAKNCDIFFPVVSGLKKMGTYINTERRLSAMRPVLEKAENERTDYEVFYGVGKALGMDSLLDGWETPKSAFELLKKTTEGMPCDITGVEFDGLTNSKGIQWPFRRGEQLLEDERRLFEDGHYYAASQKAQFIFEKEQVNPLTTTEEFPYILNTGRGTVGQWHTQTRTREIREVQDAVEKNAYVLIHPKTAEKLSVENKERIVVQSIIGTSASFEVKISKFVSENELFAPMHYLEMNNLTPSIYDSYSREPSYKSTPVTIQKVEA